MQTFSPCSDQVQRKYSEYTFLYQRGAVNMSLDYNCLCVNLQNIFQNVFSTSRACWVCQNYFLTCVWSLCQKSWGPMLSLVIVCLSDPAFPWESLRPELVFLSSHPLPLLSSISWEPTGASKSNAVIIYDMTMGLNGCFPSRRHICLFL